MIKSLTTKWLAVVAFVLTAAGCATSPSHDYDQSVNFGELKTYSWLSSKALESDDPRIANTLFNDRVVAAVDRELAARGYAKVQGESDFKVVYHMSIDTKTREDRVHSHYGYHPYDWAWRSPYHTLSTETRIREYDEGTLIIDVVDSAGERLWWRGDASSTVRKNYGPEQATKRINDAVTKILSAFPPQ